MFHLKGKLNMNKYRDGLPFKNIRYPYKNVISIQAQRPYA